MFSRYLDPKNDLAFKKIFGQERHKHIPMAFLNAVFNLTGPDEITDLEFLDTVKPPEVAARRESIVDVLVKDQGGSKYIVQMEVAKIKGFEKRAQFYAAKAYCSHFKSGDIYGDLKKVVFLAITCYVAFPTNLHYKSDGVILDSYPIEDELKNFSFTFVELPKFTKKLEELETLEEKWYYFLQHADENKQVDERLESIEEIREAYEVLERIHWTEFQIQEYERIWMSVSDTKSALLAAHNEGKEEGLRQACMERAINQGQEEGGKKARLDVASKLLMWQLSFEEIAAITGLSHEDLKQLQKTGKN